MILTDDALRTALADPTGEWRTTEGLKDSAVLLVLVRRAGVDHVVYNLRRDDLPAHAGQVSFPGGAREGDETAVACALRETEEELGLPVDAMDVLGRLPDRISIAGYLVTPFVARLVEPHPYVPLEAEVADVFEVPLPHLLERERWTFRSYTGPRRRYPHVPFFESGFHVVWGLTGVITCDFLHSAVDFDPRPPGESGN